MNSSFCFATIVTEDHLAHAQALSYSLKKIDPNVRLVVLVVENQDGQLTKLKSFDFEVLLLKDIFEFSLVSKLILKYALTNSDYLRWSLKPVLISYLLNKEIEKVLYVDCDICFYSNYDFLFELLEDNAVLLTPHWYDTEPKPGTTAFEQMLLNGFFNAGFIGCNKRGLHVMEWWAYACYNQIGIIYDKGIYYDQKYLDYLPLLFQFVKVVTHKGCNIGAKTGSSCKRVKVGEEVLIDGLYPIVFIHFNQPLVESIERGFDPLLKPYREEYLYFLKQSGINYLEQPKLNLPVLVRKVKWKLRVKTRVKNLLIRMAGRI